MRLVQRFKDWCWKVYFKSIRKKCIITPADYLYLRQEGMSFSQLIIGTRILDIERWQQDHNPHFHFANALTMIEDKEFDTIEADRRFACLLESVERNGYDPKSRIAISNCFTVNDGTHRAALAYCFGMETIPANYYNYPPHFRIEQFREVEGNSSFHNDLELIKKRYIEIQDELKSKGFTCCCIAYNINNEDLETLKQELTKSANIHKLFGVNVNKLNNVSPEKRKVLIGTDCRIENAYYISLMPVNYDYQYRDERLVFNSISKLSEKIRQKYPDFIFSDSYADGVLCFIRLSEYLIN